MQANSVYLAIAPNILRKTTQDLSRVCPGLDLLPPHTHGEMLEFAESFGVEGSVPALSVCAYPAYLYNLLRYAESGNLAAMPEDLPPMRGELQELGMKEPSPYCKVIGFVPFILAVGKEVSPPVTDWEDLCREDICNNVAVPPEDTPLPDLFDALMSQQFGEKAANVIANKNSQYTPLDINKQIDAGMIRAGLNIPAFSKTYRNGNGMMVWPQSGAWPVPLVAAVRHDASAEVFTFLSYLLSEEYQAYLSNSGNIIPVREQVPWFPEMAQADARLQWPGWDALVAQGTP